MSGTQITANGFTYWVDGTSFDPNEFLTPGEPFAYGPSAPSSQQPISPGDKNGPLGDFSLSSTIQGITFDENGTNNGGSFSIPPDPMGAVGPNHIVSVVNRSIEWHLKDGTQQSSQSLQSFFGSATATFDPKVIYDHHNDRFVVVTLERVNLGNGNLTDDESRMIIAVSDDSDPNGTWTTHTVDTLIDIGGDNFWADYPGIAIDDEAIYITNNMFPTEAPSGFGQRLWIIDKGDGTGGFYDGNAAAVTIHDPATASGGFETTMMPTLMFGSAPGTTGIWLAGYSGLSNGTQEFVQLIRVDDALGTPTFTQQFVNLGDISDTSVAFPDAPQSGTTVLIETNDSRLLDAVWRDDSLYFSTTIVGTGANAGQATAFWGEIDTTSLAAPTFVQGGEIGGEDIATGAHTYFPSIAVNADGDVGVGFSASAPSIFAGSYFTWRDVSDPAGTVRAVTTVQAGLDYYERDFGGTRNRWGDYTGTVVDPADDATFWTFNEYADLRGTVINGEDGRWATVWGRFEEDDFGETAATAGSLVAGGTATGVIETAGDVDWFAIDLVADTTYEFQQFGSDSGAGGGTLPDTVIQGLFDPTETLIPGTMNDDFNSTLNSQITYTSTTTGTHYLAASGFSPNTGTYTVSADIIQPDYVVQNTTLSSTTWTPGTPINIMFDASNIGGARPGNPEYAVYLSTDNVITDTDQLVSAAGIANLSAPNSTQPVDIPINVAIGTAPGTYFLGVIADYRSLVAESNETNNVGTAIEVTILTDPTAPVTLFDSVGGTGLSTHMTIAAALGVASANNAIVVNGATYAAGTEVVSTALDNITFDLPASVGVNATLTGTATTMSAIGDGPISLNGNTSDNALNGGNGNDLLVGFIGADTLDGGGGNDTATYGGSSVGIDVTLNGVTPGAGGEAQGDVLISIENVDGSNLADRIIGSSAANILNGFGGDDFINASTGADTINGGDNNDTIIGGDGADEINGDGGSDTASYSNSNAAVDIQLDVSNVGSGGHAQGDVLTSIENFVGSVFGDVFLMTNDSAANVVDGFNGDDFIQTYGGDDTLIGGNGDDTFVGGDGADDIQGGTGLRDLADYSVGTAGVDVGVDVAAVNLGGTAQGDTLFGVEDLIGSQQTDTITGNSVRNELLGLDGDDTINAGDNNDTVFGGDGDDLIIGGRGVDLIYGGNSMTGGDNNGETNGDTASYSNSDLRITVDLAAGTATGSGHGSGDILVDIENIFGSTFNDDLSGDSGDNDINGFLGNDEMYGLAGADLLLGGAGDDTLNGGADNDIMNGGADADTFEFTDLAFGQDTITGWQNGQDILDFTSLGLGFADFTVAAFGGGTRVTLNSDTGQHVTLIGIAPVTIDSADFA